MNNATLRNQNTVAFARCIQSVLESIPADESRKVQLFSHLQVAMRSQFPRHRDLIHDSLLELPHQIPQKGNSLKKSILSRGNTPDLNSPYYVALLRNANIPKAAKSVFRKIVKSQKHTL